MKAALVLWLSIVGALAPWSLKADIVTHWSYEVARSENGKIFVIELKELLGLYEKYVSLAYPKAPEKPKVRREAAEMCEYSNCGILFCTIEVDQACFRETSKRLYKQREPKYLEELAAHKDLLNWPERAAATAEARELFMNKMRNFIPRLKAASPEAHSFWYWNSFSVSLDEAVRWGSPLAELYKQRANYMRGSDYGRRWEPAIP